MKHEVSSLITKKALAKSLKKAMSIKPFSKITVTEIIQDCNVNRKTFYYHFEDIYDLLKWMLEQEAIEVVKQYDLLNDAQEALTFVLDYVDNNIHIINCAYDSIGRDELKRFFYRDFSGVVSSIIEKIIEMNGIEIKDDFKNLLIMFYTEALTGTLINYLHSEVKISRQELIDYMLHILKSSISSVLEKKANDIH
ncbi:MAG: TetR/AcrR family transcriptional regulator C-terminal domain-containing protein [Traorella sp.]